MPSSIPGISISIKVEDAELRDLLNTIIRLPSEMKEPLRQVGEYMFNKVEERFDTERDEKGHPWKRLSERTQRDRRSLGYDPRHPILYRTGNLRFHNKMQVFDDSVDVFNDAMSGRGGTVEFYGQFHNEGAVIRNAKGTHFLPKRGFMFKSDRDNDEIVKIFYNWLDNKFEKRFHPAGLAGANIPF